MITMQTNQIISSPDQPTSIFLAQTRETLIDTEIYSRFIYSCENNFRRSRFYKAYKCNVMNCIGNRDAMMASINSDMADIELHHHFPELKHAAIMICEHTLNTKGCVTTFEIVKELEEAHRNNMMAVILLSATQHQAYHADPSAFISLAQCYGDPFKFIDKYLDGMTLDIAFKMLLQLKQEEVYNKKSFSANMVKARDQIKDFSGLVV